jgi:hypothetical protein
LSSLADAVQPSPQDLRFLNYFLNNPALKELIDVSFFKLKLKQLNLEAQLW